jgi:hypothetical protein
MKALLLILACLTFGETFFNQATNNVKRERFEGLVFEADTIEVSDSVNCKTFVDVTLAVQGIDSTIILVKGKVAGLVSGYANTGSDWFTIDSITANGIYKVSTVPSFIKFESIEDDDSVNVYMSGRTY